MRSVSVVLPASMWAAIPMLRVRSSGNLRSGEFGFFPPAADFFSIVAVAINLPAEVSERAVGLRHFVSVFALFDCVSLAVSRVPDFVGERIRHGHSAAIIGIGNNPAHGQRDLPGGWHFHRDLISGAADATRLDLEPRPNVLQRLVKNFEWINR